MLLRLKEKINIMDCSDIKKSLYPHFYKKDHIPDDKKTFYLVDVLAYCDML